MQAEIFRSEIRPGFNGGLLQAQYLIGGVHIVLNKTQRNNINFLRRKLDASTTTLAFVASENRIYKLINNPNTNTTSDSDWEVVSLGDTSAFRPIGLWDADNDDPVLQDTDANGRNGQFYFVDNAPTQRNVTYTGLFGGQTETVVNGDLIVSVGDKWVVVSSSTTWGSLQKPQVIDDYVNGIVISHTHMAADITDLNTLLDQKFDDSDLADLNIDFDLVPDSAITSVEFLRKYYYTKSEINDLIDEFSDGAPTNFLDLTDTPNTYVGNQGKILRVNAEGTGLEFVTHAGLPFLWGGNAFGDDSILGLTDDFNLTVQTGNADLTLRTNGTDRIVISADGRFRIVPLMDTPITQQNGDIWIQQNGTIKYMRTGTIVDIPTLTTGTGASTRVAYFANANTITGNGDFTWSNTDKILQVFGHININSVDSRAGLKLASLSADPTTSLQDGQLWYNSTQNAFKGRVNNGYFFFLHSSGGAQNQLAIFNGQSEIVTNSNLNYTGDTLFNGNLALHATGITTTGQAEFFFRNNTGNTKIQALASGTSVIVEANDDFVMNSGDDVILNSEDVIFNTSDLVQFNVGRILFTSGVTQDDTLSRIAALDSVTGQLKWRDATTLGITNGASANELTKSDGTNIIGTKIFSTSDGNATFGDSSLAGLFRELHAEGSEEDVGLFFASKGLGLIMFGVGGQLTAVYAKENISHLVPTVYNIADNNTSSVVTGAFYEHQVGPGTAGAGIGIAAEFLLENDAGNRKTAAKLDAVLTDVTANAEYGEMRLQLISNGTLGQKVIFRSDGRLTIGADPIDSQDVLTRGYLESTPGGRLQHVKVQVESSDILNSNTTPIEIIPAPGVGKLIRVVDVVMYYNFVTTAYDTNTDLIFVYSGFVASAVREQPTTILTQGSNGIFTTSGASILAIVGGLENKGVLLMTNNGNPQNGDGTLTIHVYYYIMDV